MPLQLLSYVYIDAEKQEAHLDALALKSFGPDLEDYIEEHINTIYKKDQSTGPTAWVEEDDEERFRSLLEGDSSEFLTTTGIFAERLAKVIDRRMKSGFLVTVRREFAGEIQAAVLKLDKKNDLVARSQLRDGKYDLSIVQELLDAPRDLQKGAVYPDGRVNSAAVVGEKHQHTEYFLNVLGLRQVYTEKDSAVQFLRTVASSLPPKNALRAVQTILNEKKKSSSARLLNKIQNIATDEERAIIKGQLARKPKGLSKFNPQDFSAKIEAQVGEIKITGSPRAWEEMITITRAANGMWRISIEAPQEPKITVK